jgi:LDH2 family malate/lactate/ureidoglycolate dehydrogenase
MSAGVDRFDAGSLEGFATSLFAAAGLDREKAAVVAGLLVEADLLGHSTHGLQLASGYLGDLDAGSMARHGAPAVVADRGAVVTWDGRRLPGVWLTATALDLALERADSHGSATVVVRNSHHIGCLAAYLGRATERGCMAIIASSDPSEASVVPFGGTRPVFTPDPIAIGIPTGGDPVLVDISASITTNGMTARLKARGERFPGQWGQDAAGRPSDDPGAVLGDPPGSLLPVGGRDHGHKGYGLALMIEALTQGLGGFGRADGPTGWGASVFVQVYDPAAFGGWADFNRQTGWIVDACRQSPPAEGGEPVRLPGERALERKREALAKGLPLQPETVASLRPWATRLAIAMPEPL